MWPVVGDNISDLQLLVSGDIEDILSYIQVFVTHSGVLMWLEWSAPPSCKRLTRVQFLATVRGLWKSPWVKPSAKYLTFHMNFLLMLRG